MLFVTQKFGKCNSKRFSFLYPLIVQIKYYLLVCNSFYLLSHSSALRISVSFTLEINMISNIDSVHGHIRENRNENFLTIVVFREILSRKLTFFPYLSVSRAIHIYTSYHAQISNYIDQTCLHFSDS